MPDALPAAATIPATIEVVLYDRSGGVVEFVEIAWPTPGEGPQILAWGSRFFYPVGDREYIECRVLQAFTAREIQAMERG